MASSLRSIGVFCGARDGTRPIFRQAAFALGEAIGELGCELIWGGAQVGLMGAVADGAISKGARAIGVLPHGLARNEFAHPRAHELFYVDTMAERKNRIIALADAFVTLPGGYGTLDELFEVLTLIQVGLQPKPAGLLNVDGYWNALEQQIAHTLHEGFVTEEMRRWLLSDTDPKRLLQRLAEQPAPAPSVRWLKQP